MIFYYTFYDNNESAMCYEDLALNELNERNVEKKNFNIVYNVFSFLESQL